MNKTKIEWCDSTWNPVTGCLHDCEYCYARKIANRFGQFPCENSNCVVCGDCNLEPSYNCERYIPYEKIHDLENPVYLYNPKKKQPYPYGFEPTFHKYRLDEPSKKTKPRNIFVCSMADLFGNWVPDEWIEAIYEVCKKESRHNYLFLTKNPIRYEMLHQEGKLIKDKNLWYGYSITDNNTFQCWSDSRYKTFISIEPILEDLNERLMNYVVSTNWIIIGAETGNRKDKIIPKKEWIDSIVEKCKGANIPVFMKDSLIPIVGEENMLREFPKELRRI